MISSQSSARGHSGKVFHVEHGCPNPGTVLAEDGLFIDSLLCETKSTKSGISDMS